MAKIKAFTYLDEYKMYSISSQIFEGLTEYITNYSANTNRDIEKQDGPIGSGRVLADIISKETGVEEKKFLHDYSYTLFEEKLFKDERVLIVNSDNINEQLMHINEYSFIKITGRILFNDIAIIKNTLNHFNEIGEAIAYVSSFQQLEKMRAQYNETLEQTKNPNRKAEIKKDMKKALDVLEIAKQNNLYHDQEFLDKLAYIIDYGYKDQFEVQIMLPNTEKGKTIFSANLKREYLKEREHLLIKKHSRYSEKEFTILGMITQNQGRISNTLQGTVSQEIKEMLVYIISQLSTVEEKFTGKLSNEVIIDPIAIYREL